LRKPDAILKAARAVFLEHGFGASTTDMIQAAAGVSKSTLYTYFPTKKLLFEAVCRMKSEAFEMQLRDAVGDERQPRDYLNRFGVAFLAILLSEEGLAFYRLMIGESARFPKLGRAFYAAGVKISSDMIESYLKDAHAAGRLRVPHPAVSTEHFLGMLRGELFTRVMLNVSRPPSAPQRRRHVSVTVDQFLAAHAPT
jgi:TetR/AcrR family transcriptional regulator, mexJK operon transcriptional repressor